MIELSEVLGLSSNHNETSTMRPDLVVRDDDKVTGLTS